MSHFPTPSQIAQARQAITNPHLYTRFPALRQAAFLTLKQARGQTVNFDRLPGMEPARTPDPDMPGTLAACLAQAAPRVRGRIHAHIAALTGGTHHNSGGAS